MEGAPLPSRIVILTVWLFFANSVSAHFQKVAPFCSNCDEEHFEPCSSNLEMNGGREDLIFHQYFCNLDQSLCVLVLELVNAMLPTIELLSPPRSDYASGKETSRLARVNSNPGNSPGGPFGGSSGPPFFSNATLFLTVLVFGGLCAGWSMIHRKNRDHGAVQKSVTTTPEREANTTENLHFRTKRIPKYQPKLKTHKGRLFVELSPKNIA